MNTILEIKDLKKVFKYIILDGVPVNGLADSLILSSISDKTVIVSKYGFTDINDLENTKKSLENIGADIVGVILNKVPKTRSKYGRRSSMANSKANGLII